MRAPFSRLEGSMAVLPRTDVNTDAIIPSAWLRTAKADLGKGLFGGERYDEAGRERPDFVLNRPPFRAARILLADENFGCGSSREAAVWALLQFGIGCVLAPSFADIFYENAFRNGLLAALIAPEDFAGLAAAVAQAGDDPVFAIDLGTRTVTGRSRGAWRLRVPAARAEALLRGDDEIDLTLRHEAEIASWYAAARQRRQWLYAGSIEKGQQR